MLPPVSSPWAGFRNDPLHTGRSSYLGPTQGAILWSYLADQMISSSPAVDAANIVYFGSDDNHLRALHGANGSLLWSANLGRSVESSPCLTPDGSRVVVGSDNGSVYWLDAETGSVTWRIDLTDNGIVDSSPVVSAGGVVFIGAYPGNLYALSNVSSTPVWNHTFGQPVASSPALDENSQIVVVGCYDGTVYAVDSVNGVLQWKYVTSAGVVSSPTIDVQRALVLVGSFDMFLYALNESTGALVWKFNASNSISSSPALSGGGMVIFGDDSGIVHGLNGTNGLEVWNYATASNLGLYSSPALDAQGLAFIGTEDGHVIALDEATGTLMWKLSLSDNPVLSSPALGRNGMLYIGSLDSRMYAIGNYTDPPRKHKHTHTKLYAAIGGGLGGVILLVVAICVCFWKGWCGTKSTGSQTEQQTLLA
jgi:eukaryotic-like serine/threonine-protein kinase